MLVDSAHHRLRPFESLFLVIVVLCCTALCLYVTHKHLQLVERVGELERREEEEVVWRSSLGKEARRQEEKGGEERGGGPNKAAEGGTRGGGRNIPSDPPTVCPPSFFAGPICSACSRPTPWTIPAAADAAGGERRKGRSAGGV